MGESLSDPRRPFPKSWPVVDWSHIVIAMGAGSVASVCGKVAKAQIQWSFQGDSKTMSTSSHRLPVTDVTDVTDSLGDRPHTRART
jgi:hypothetical protein